jgi:hypothetical protein
MAADAYVRLDVFVYVCLDDSNVYCQRAKCFSPLCYA